MTSYSSHCLTNTRNTSELRTRWFVSKGILNINRTRNRTISSTNCIVTNIRIGRETKILNKPFTSSKRLYTFYSKRSSIIRVLTIKNADWIKIFTNTTVTNVSIIERKSYGIETKSIVISTKTNFSTIFIRYKFFTVHFSKD